MDILNCNVERLHGAFEIGHGAWLLNIAKRGERWTPNDPKIPLGHLSIKGGK